MASLAKKNTSTLWLIGLFFLLPPIITVVLHLNREHLHFKTIQHGTLIQPPQKLELSNIQTIASTTVPAGTISKRWQIVYLEPELCEENCQTNKQLLSNLHIALASDQKRVNIISACAPEIIHPHESVLIVDPTGYFMMHYHPGSDVNGVLKDIKQLLKYSHVG